MMTGQIVNHIRKNQLHKGMIWFLLILVFLVSEGCGSRKETHTAGSTEEPQQEQAGDQGPEDAASTVSWTGMAQTGSMDLSYAECFSVDYFGDDYSLIRIEDSGSFLLVEENRPVPADLPEDIVVLRKPLDHIYDASSSTLDFFRELDSLSSVAMTSTEAEDWAIPEIRELVASDQITYVGKYRAPDYEYILDEDCDLAIENTMIYHKPEVKEKLEELGIPVLVERSSYEPHPLGRLEWIRFYGLLTGKTEEADRFYESQLREIEDILTKNDPAAAADRTKDGPSAGIFYLNGSGAAVIRRPGDYLSRMIELAGGSYAYADLTDEDGTVSSSMTIQMENFYQASKDADLLIYNTTVAGGPASLEDLRSAHPLLADLKAVREGRLYCTGMNMFQQVTGTCTMIRDFYTILREEDSDDTKLTYLRKLS